MLCDVYVYNDFVGLFIFIMGAVIGLVSSLFHASVKLSSVQTQKMLPQWLADQDSWVVMYAFIPLMHIFISLLCGIISTGFYPECTTSFSSHMTALLFCVCDTIILLYR